VIAGLTLQTSAVEIYRALLESIAFGNRVIVDNFRREGFQLAEIVACGGVAEKSPFLMQLFADTSGLPVTVPASAQVPARGSALFGAVAAGPQASGFAGITEAARALRPGAKRTYARTPRTSRSITRCTRSGRTSMTLWGAPRSRGSTGSSASSSRLTPAMGKLSATKEAM